ncbi:MAG: fumarylacetoacetate hydrolase family protein [Candidatus Omnitrophica bacterium]|nr:fumarylacetoacetate hydrolase family protein [Candidatus Omnitrophota bacterium]
MKLVTFQPKKGGMSRFGYIEGSSVFAFREFPTAADYLFAFPKSEKLAREIFRSGKGEGEMSIAEVRFLAPIPHPSALLDFSLASRHLSQAVETLLKHEYGWLERQLVKMSIRANAKKKRQAGMLEYYKANHHAVSGDGDEVEWPDYTAYLDVEAELGVVVGTKEHPVAGYLILNDWSARDVQMPEMFALSLTRSKDFNKSYGLGPYWVTPDEIPNPLALKADVFVGDRWHWQGSTSEYSTTPEKAIEYLRTIFDPVPGTVFGMGTITNCCGLEHDLWVKPGDQIRIAIEGLGELTQFAPQKHIDFSQSRWKK